MPVALGVALEVTATIVGTVGKQLVSCSAKADDKFRARVLKFSGLAITTVLGPIMDLGAYAFAPQSLLAPLAGLDIVWNMCSAPFTLGDRLTCRHIVGTLLVFAGATTASFVGPRNTVDAPGDEPLALLRSVFISVRFATYACVMLALFAVMGTVLVRRPKDVGDRLRGLALGVSAGAIAGQMCFLSAALTLFRLSSESGDWSAWVDWLPYTVALLAVVCAVGNIPLMTKGLQEYESIFMVTLFEGCHIAFACISGQVVLREMDAEPQWRRIAYWFCVVTILSGLLVIQGAARGNAVREEPNLMASKEHPSEADDESPMEEDTEAELGARRSTTVIWAGAGSGAWLANGEPLSSQVDDVDSSDSEGSSDEEGSDMPFAESGPAARGQ